MNCKDCRELINAYFDNGIDPANDRLLQEHLAGCEKCRAELEFLQDYKTRLAGIKPVKAPAGFMHELRRRIESERNRPLLRYYSIVSDYMRSIHFPVEAAALVVLVSIVFTLYRPDKLYMNRPAVTVTEYSGSESKTVPGMPGKGEGTVADGVKKQVYDDNSIPVREAETSDKAYPAEKEKEESGGIADDVKDESAVAGEIAASTENEKDLGMFESNAADKKDTYRSERRVMGKQRLDAAAEITPGDVCRRYNAEIVKAKKLDSGAYEYTIEIRENNAEALIAGLRRHFTVTYRSKEIINNRTYLILEITE